MSNPDDAYRAVVLEHARQALELSYCLAYLELAFIRNDGNTGRVIPTVLQVPKPVDEEGYDWFLAHVAYDSTHDTTSFLDRHVTRNAALTAAV